MDSGFLWSLVFVAALFLLKETEADSRPYKRQMFRTSCPSYKPMCPCPTFENGCFLCKCLQSGGSASSGGGSPSASSSSSGSGSSGSANSNPFGSFHTGQFSGMSSGSSSSSSGVSSSGSNGSYSGGSTSGSPGSSGGTSSGSGSTGNGISSGGVGSLVCPPLPSNCPPFMVKQDSQGCPICSTSGTGKCMENLRNRTDVKLVHSPEKLRKLVAKPSLDRIRVFNEDLIGLQHKKIKLKLDRPIYTGACILELAKLAMYEFHYEYMKPKYGEAVELLYTDTDSLVYEVSTLDLYRDIAADGQRFDFSNYPEKHFAFSTANKKCIGKMKDEQSSIPITQWVGLKSKMYSFLTEYEEVNKAKGVAKSVVKKDINHEDYLRCLKEETNKICEMRRIGGERHKLYMYNLRKKSLDCYDDKVWLCSDGLTSFPYGHYATKREEK